MECQIFLQIKLSILLLIILNKDTASCVDNLLALYFKLQNNFYWFFRWHNKGKSADHIFNKWIAHYKALHYENPLDVLKSINTNSSTFFKPIVIDYDKLFSIVLKPDEPSPIIDDKESFRRLFYR